MDKTRIAVVSTDGVRVDDHFGKADRFLIYDMDEQLTWIEDRPCDPLSTDDPDHRFDGIKFGHIGELLRDCSRVYVTRIGTMPAAKLADVGIEVVVREGLIADILE